MSIQRKHKIPVFIFLFLVGVGFGVWGMVLPPNGVIDGSVLILIAQIFVLAASVYGFEVHFDIKEGKFDAGESKEEHRQDEPINDEPSEFQQP